jgi:D12 class N6 adenine-specific DNA methyltransferase.
MEKPIYSTAPLPFQGQKRKFLKEVRTALCEFNPSGEITTIVDLFGGSGLLAHTAKRYMPQCRVIYNDYDNFSQRLENVDKTNDLLAGIREILADEPRKVAIKHDKRAEILALIKTADQAGFVDYITLSSSLLFSQCYVLNYQELEKAGFYNRVRKDDYVVAGYLDGLEVLRKDYKVLFEEFRGRRDVLFLVDPPYLSTDTSTYNSDKYWRLKDYLDVLHVVTNDNYVYFTSNKSQIVELLDWFAENYGYRTPFSDAVVKTNQVRGKVIDYTDIMLYKKY